MFLKIRFIRFFRVTCPPTGGSAFLFKKLNTNEHDSKANRFFPMIGDRVNRKLYEIGLVVFLQKFNKLADIIKNSHHEAD
jgi:hypothetical protein